MTQKSIIIAEAGVNHNGSLERAKELIVVAAQAGADIVKFQTFKADFLVSKKAPKAEYQTLTTNKDQSQYEMLKELELSETDHLVLMKFCNECNIKFLSTPFDMGSIDILEGLGQNIWKVPSGEITNLPYLQKIGAFGQEVIMSTGMANISEIEAALHLLEISGTPQSKVTLLHCNTEYPTPMRDVNLRAIHTMQKSFPNVRVGYSDHTQGIEVAIAAVAMGACLIEKHFTLDKTLPGPDHKASADPEELIAMVTAIRNIEKALGDGVKQATPSEKANKIIVRKSIAALRDIACGEVFTEKNITAKRPGKGISPMRWNDVLGKKAIKDFATDDLIELSDQV